MNFLIIIFLNLIIGLLSAEQFVFKADYDVYWRGWYCGTMQSELSHVDHHEYSYKQQIKSTLFLFNFAEYQESRFFLKDNQCIPHSYILSKEQSHAEKIDYKISFEDHLARLEKIDINSQEKLEQIFEYLEPCYDRLVMQLQLIQNLRNHGIQDITLSCIDYKGVQDYFYQTETTDHDKVILTSTHRNRINTFVLDPQKGFFPIQFEQKKGVTPLIRGELKHVEFDEEWFMLWQKNINKK
ncbi:hypothetical protein EBR43_02715 [bacterium]|nr:hypothetical protein [bacterium]NBX72392.1 hypothetical protein [bacterium]